MPTAVRTRHLPVSEPGTPSPIVPTIVVSSYKGGVWKTSVAVAVAERLAYCGLSVALVVTDTQEDARRRLGVRDVEQDLPRVSRGAGTITVIGARASRAIDVLFRSGFGPLGIPKPDLAIVDTAANEHGASLPGTLVVALTDGTDASSNLAVMLRRTPATSRILLARTRSTDPGEWENDAAAIAEAAGHGDLLFMPAPLPASSAIERALGQGRSVWGLARRGSTQGFLEGIETITCAAWSWFFPGRELPPSPPAVAGGAFVRGWDDEDADAAR